MSFHRSPFALFDIDEEARTITFPDGKVIPFTVEKNDLGQRFAVLEEPHPDYFEGSTRVGLPEPMTEEQRAESEAESERIANLPRRIIAHGPYGKRWRVDAIFQPQAEAKVADMDDDELLALEYAMFDDEYESRPHLSGLDKTRGVESSFVLTCRPDNPAAIARDLPKPWPTTMLVAFEAMNLPFRVRGEKEDRPGTIGSYLVPDDMVMPTHDELPDQVVPSVASIEEWEKLPEWTP